MLWGGAILVAAYEVTSRPAAVTVVSLGRVTLGLDPRKSYKHERKRDVSLCLSRCCNWGDAASGTCHSMAVLDAKMSTRAVK